MALSRSLGGFPSSISGLCPRCTALEAEAQRGEGARLSELNRGRIQMGECRPCQCQYTTPTAMSLGDQG